MGIFALTGILLALFTSTITSEDGNTNDLNNVNTNKTDEEATANITITANSTHGDPTNKTADAGDNTEEATSDAPVPANNTHEDGANKTADAGENTEEATSDAPVPANNTTQEATIDTTVSANNTVEEATTDTITTENNSTEQATTDTTVPANNIVEEATTEAKIPAKNTTEKATSDAPVPANNTTQEATIDTTISANNTVEEATTDAKIPAKNSTEEAKSDTVFPANNTTQEATIVTLVSANNTTEEATFDAPVPANNTDYVNTTKPDEETTANITITANNTDTVNTTKPHGNGANGTTDAGDNVEEASTDTTTTANNSTEQATTDTTVPADNTPGDGANGTTVAAEMDDVNTIKPDEGTTANTINTANITDMPKATTETTTTKKPDDETTTKATTTTTYPFSSTTASGDDKKDTEPPPPEPVVNEWYLSFITSANVSEYELDELLYDYLQTKGGKKTLELAKPLLYNLLEGLLFPSEDESKDDKGGNATTTTETSPMTLMLQESLLPLVNVILTPDENGTSSIDDIISVLEPYLNESLGPTMEPPKIAGFSLDPETPNGKTFLRLATKFFRTKRITVPLGDYLRQVVELMLSKDSSINYKDALLEAAIHAFSCPSSEDLLNELAVFLLKDVILESTDLISCGLTSALDYLLAALAGKASSSSTGISLPLTDGTIEKLKNLGNDIILQALELADTRKIFRQLKYLFNQSGLPLPGDKLVYVALRAAVTSEGIGSGGGLTFVDLMEAVNASGLKLSSVGESLLLSVATSEDAPPAFFNIFDMFPVLAREVPALSNLPDMNFVDLLADIL